MIGRRGHPPAAFQFGTLACPIRGAECEEENTIRRTDSPSRKTTLETMAQQQARSSFRCRPATGWLSRLPPREGRGLHVEKGARVSWQYTDRHWQRDGEPGGTAFRVDSSGVLLLRASEPRTRVHEIPVARYCPPVLKSLLHRAVLQQPAELRPDLTGASIVVSHLSLGVHT